MNLKKQKTSLRGFVIPTVIFLLAAVYCSGPFLVHRYLDMSTSTREVKSKSEIYWNLAELESSTGSMSAERLDLRNWFHVRGYEIGPGNEPKTNLQKWQEIIDYYK